MLEGLFESVADQLTFKPKAPMSITWRNRDFAKTMQIKITGKNLDIGTALRDHVGEKLRQLLSAMPAAYQLLPTRPCVEDRAGNPIDVLADESWMPPEARHLVRDARQFRRDLGMRSSVPTTSIFGYGLKTQLKLVVDRDDKGSWLDVKFDMDARGDDTITEWSAVLDGSDIHPVRQRHGALYVDGDVKMRLKIELGRKP